MTGQDSPVATRLLTHNKYPLTLTWTPGLILFARFDPGRGL